MVRFHLMNGERVQFTPEEEAFRDAEEKAYEENRPVKAFKKLRKRRDALLTRSDWVVSRSGESGEDIPDSWVSYRQTLRDLPAQYDDETILSEEVIWPNEPE